MSRCRKRELHTQKILRPRSFVDRMAHEKLLVLRRIQLASCLGRPKQQIRVPRVPTFQYHLRFGALSSYSDHCIYRDQVPLIPLVAIYCDKSCLTPQTPGSHLRISASGRTENKRLTESRLGFVPLQGSKRRKSECDPAPTASDSER